MYRTIDTARYSVDSFFAKTKQVGDCLEWQGSRYKNGYGKLGRVGIVAHRIAYELTRGKVPTNMCLDHLCKNRLCVNPEHLEVVTLVENVMRGDSQHAKNARKTHCKQGHEFTPDNTYTPPRKPNSRYCKKCQRLRDTQYRLRTMAPKRS
jgi:hypothetical protein